ncbi:hypothetical protein AO380_0151 [Moraxella catarrhalis]|nr:hypothetical protein AO380_0151 [Moraxella catarrhalis]
MPCVVVLALSMAWVWVFETAVFVVAAVMVLGVPSDKLRDVDKSPPPVKPAPAVSWVALSAF